MPYKKVKDSRTIREFSAGAVVGGLLVILWGVPAILLELGVMARNPISPEWATAGAALLGASVWGIKRRLSTETKIWR